jgi:glucose/arabinose dehydrogenase
MSRIVSRPGIRGIAGLGVLLIAGCGTGDTRSAASLGDCDADNGGLALPAGFCAVVFADLDGSARHIAVRPDGDVFVAAASRRDGTGGGVWALRDTTGDGRADVVTRFGPDGSGGTGIAIAGDHVWFAPDDAVLRYTVRAGALEPAAGADTIVAGLPADRSHRAKSLALRGDSIFVNIGSPTNSCQEQDRQPGSPGMDPCPALETRAGIWRFDANRTGQTRADGERFATGIRNAVAIAIRPDDGALFAVQHGRDQLGANWGFTDEQSAAKPAEELFRIEGGDDFGWPYCWFDPETGVKVLAPEYGGDGTTQGRCADKEAPVYAFPAHWAPDGLLFYRGGNFPDRYRRGIFVAFHGSWNRAPLPQGGYNVAFLPLDGDVPAAAFEIFSDGFAGPVVQPGDAEHRPVGLAEGPDGALYITDDQAGRVWRVTFRGS